MREGPTVLQRGATLLLFFGSGFAGLVYEVLWMKELALLFGSTAHAAATTLAAFFLGLVAGASFWGRRAGRVRRPLRGYAYLELGVGLGALLYFLLLDVYYAIYGSLFDVLGGNPVLFLIVKFLLAIGMLFPPSFLMGGTLPMMSQHLIRSNERLGRTGTTLYAINTLGAAAGAFAAGFHLPRYLGFTGAYLVAIVATAVVATLAWALGSDPVRQTLWDSPDAGGGRKPLEPAWSPVTIRWLALFSGFAALGLEVLWTRMFAQVLQNSVYTFAAILVVFLFALATGAMLANRLIRGKHDPMNVLFVMLVLSALLVGATPFLFYSLTDGLTYLGGERGFGPYILGTFGYAFVVMFPAVLVLGSIFPYLLRLAEPFASGAGRAVGDLSAVNTLGAVAGSLAAGFALLDLIGLWSSIRLIAIAYACAALLLTSKLGPGRQALRTVPVTVLLLLVSLLDPSRLPVVKVDPVRKGESVLRVWEGNSGITAVIRQPDSLSIKLNNDYSLGGTGAARYEEGQAHLPLWLHPRPRSVFFLGMGTGITAGAALVHPVERVVVSELVPDVVEAARTFFGPYLHGLFEDPRATVVAEDGRNYLFGTSERFDLIIADLFMTWKAGVGSLYSHEHYEAARGKLRKGGLYVQWLPLYQLSREEFGIIARTMRETFPLLTMWRGAIAPGWETAALIGHREATALDRDALIRRLRQSSEIALAPSPGDHAEAGRAEAHTLTLDDLMLQYCGNLTASGSLLDGYSVNTDDRPVIEYEAPITHRRNRAKLGAWFVGGELLEFLGDLLRSVPPEDDPYLEALLPPERNAVRAGVSLYLARVLENQGEDEAAWAAMQEFDRLYAAAARGAGGGESALEKDRRELNELIAKYERRIRALREHLREAEEGAGAGAD